MFLAKSLTLPCGALLSNRFAKSAMSEAMSSKDHGPSKSLITAYQKWSEGQCGLLITGNVMIDSSALGEPRNVVIEDERHLQALTSWALAATNLSQIWVQLNHPGKQSPAFLSPQPVAPSPLPLEGSLKSAFKTPRALRDEEILEIIKKFERSASIVKKAGFSGVQIHGAHGYLVSQFLSPKHNQRTDRWGGSLDNRLRFIIEVYRSIRREVGNSFPVSIKLNSSDFQKGGFGEDDSLVLATLLCEEGIDLIEISGGNYEKPVMMGIHSSTNEREAYFASFSQKMREKSSAPIMLTGGFRSARAMEDALMHGVCDVIGLARPLALDAKLPAKILKGDLNYRSCVKTITTGISFLDRLSMLNITWYEHQIARLGRGKRPDANLSPFVSILKTFAGLGFDAFKKRRA